eukprot:m.262185 g.262185  ORF g.262185 m.262185 type:complete len:315 (+) comp44710_c0_seq1:388-1332(+)
MIGKLAILAVLGTTRHFERDRNSLSYWNCYAMNHSIPFHVDTKMYRADFWNKQLAIEKHLSHYEWILYVDGDTIVTNFSYSMMEYVETLRPDEHVVLSEIHFGDAGGFDAGVFMVRNSPTGHDFLKRWMSLSDTEWYNADNGALNVVFMSYFVKVANRIPCATYIQLSNTTKATYNNFFDCMYRELGESDQPYGFRANRSWSPFKLHRWRGNFSLSSVTAPYTEKLIHHGKNIRIPSSNNYYVTNGLCGIPRLPTLSPTQSHTFFRNRGVRALQAFNFDVSSSKSGLEMVTFVPIILLVVYYLIKTCKQHSTKQ